MRLLLRVPATLSAALAVFSVSAECPAPLSLSFTNSQVRLDWPTLGTLQSASTVLGPWVSLTNGFGPFNVPRTNPAAFFRLLVGPQVVNKESILFYASATGAAAIGQVTSNQFATRRVYSTGFATGWTNIVQVPGQGAPMFFYNPTLLTGAFGYLSADNYANYLTEGGFGHWTHIEGVVKDGGNYLFFYNTTNGGVAWGDNYDPIAPGWTHIVRARHSNLTLFYKAGDGSGTLDFSPPVTVLGAGALPVGSTHVATMPRSAGGDYVLFYKKTDGSGSVGILDVAGFHPTIVYGPGSFGNWTHVVGLNNNFFFYNGGNGAAAIATMSNDTNFVTVTSYSAGTFSSGWTSIARADLNERMQAFCWPESAAAGGAIDFFASTGANTYSISIVRLLNQPLSSVDFTAIQQNAEMTEQVICGPFASTGRMQNCAHSPDQGCADWTRSFSLAVPSNWVSGIYAAKFADSAGSITYVPFVVKAAPLNQGDFLLIANTTTWNCYNSWGGYSRYEVPGGGPWALSYLRPNGRTVNPAALDGDYQYHSKHLTRGEIWVMNALQGSGYRVDCATDLDLHAGIPNLNNYKGLILNVHPEYFSVTMFKNITNYLGHGGKLIYLGANGLYDAVDISSDSKTLTVYGTSGAGRSHLFRELSPPRPESAVLGIAYPWSLDCGDGANLPRSRVGYEVLDASHPLFAGTGMTNGARFGAAGWCVDEFGSSLLDGGASGWEIDVPDTNSPPNLQILARGTNPFTVNCAPYNVPMGGHMVYYQTTGGGFVFSVGSMTFGGSLVVDPVIQQIVRNVLDACLH